MRAKTTFNQASIEDHLGIPIDHPDLIKAQTDFQTNGLRTLLLVIASEPGRRPTLVRLTGHVDPDFYESAAYQDLAQQLFDLEGRRLTERELFSYALYHLYLRREIQFPPTLDAPLDEAFQNRCFQLLFDFAPGDYCIAATVVKHIPERAGYHQICYCKFPIERHSADDLWQYQPNAA